MNATTIWDPLHKVWRCMWDAAKLAGLFSYVLLANIIVNLERGPFNGEAHF